MISLIPELKQNLLAFSSEAFNKDILSQRERSLAMLGAAFILQNTSLIKQTIITAKQNGLKNEEIAQVHAISTAISAHHVANLDLINFSTPSELVTSNQSKCCE